MKRFALAIALACVLSGSALAGDIATPGAPAPSNPPPPGEMGNGGSLAPGDMGSGGVVGDMGNGGAATVLLTLLDLVF